MTLLEAKHLVEQTNLNGTNILVLSPTPTYPQDQGNRKRIYCICSELKKRGGRIHFLHYPQEWFSRIPTEANRAMFNQWDSFYLIPPTRPLHTPAQGDDHTIDEWWDDAIGNYLNWLFARNSYDVFIVNYTYLSKAFEFVPQGVYKILDTHDKFTNRRQLLEDQGIPREFFYTTQDQEAIALDRAELVWAIKEEEADFFRSITSTPVITMPHIEPQQHVRRVKDEKDEDYLVLGMIGARNAINVQNAKTFVEQVLPKFRHYLAPIKVKFAGGMCDALEDLRQISGVELLGRVKTIDEFYQAVDIVTVPLTFSTGLKIKAVEALATGLPIVAHRHALEGIPTTHPYHQCSSLDEITEHCLELAYDIDKVAELSIATQDTYHRMQIAAEDAMEQTSARIMREKPVIVIALNNEDFFEDWAPGRENAVQAIHYLKHLAQLIYYVDAPLNAKRVKSFEYHDAVGKVVLSPQSAQLSGLIDESGNEVQSSELGLSYAVSSLEDICCNRTVIALWLLSIPTEIQAGPTNLLKEIPTYVRTDAIRSRCNLSDDALSQALEHFDKLTLISNSLAEMSLNQRLISSATSIVVPYWRELPWQIRDRQPTDHIMILATAETMHLAYVLWNVCMTLTVGESYPKIYHTPLCDSLIDDAAWITDKIFMAEIASVEAILSDFEIMGRYPRVVVDISDENHLFSIYRETLKRAGIPIITPMTGVGADLHSLIRGREPLLPFTTSQLIDTLTRLIGSEQYWKEIRKEVQDEAGRQYGADSGWARVWGEVSKTKLLSASWV